MTIYPNPSAIADFCGELREARLFQRISLDEVARSTRITPEYLRALEDGQWDSVPAAYVRGYLGAYAAAIGMNRDKVLRDYDLLLSTGRASERASIDDAPPLLSRPEIADVARQKVQASWFIALASHRRLFYVIGGLILLAPLILAKWMQHPAADVSQTPFMEVAEDYSSHIHSPYNVVPCDSPRNDRGRRHIDMDTVRIVSIDYARYRITRDHRSRLEYRLKPYDTLLIAYFESCEIQALPGGRSRVTKNGIAVFPDSVKNTIERYILYADRITPIQMADSISSE